jgi:hypothetical protein
MWCDNQCFRNTALKCKQMSAYIRWIKLGEMAGKHLCICSIRIMYSAKFQQNAFDGRTAHTRSLINKEIGLKGVAVEKWEICPREMCEPLQLQVETMYLVLRMIILWYIFHYIFRLVWLYLRRLALKILFFFLWLYNPIQAFAASMKLSVSLQLLDLGSR